jgi:S-adenosylmethionine:tRNA ribosyltransferase-isomerase
MVLDTAGGVPSDHVFRDLPSLLRPGDLLVVNRSRVFPARLRGRRMKGGEAEVLLLRRTAPRTWEALLRPGRRLRVGAEIRCESGLVVTVLGGPLAEDGRREVRLDAPGDPDALVETAGQVPLPPYIQRRPETADSERYQTVYARESGSVAAPTAGLHFTPELLAALPAAGVELAELFLHVGPGTFRPVKVADVRDHRVASEPFEIPPETASAITRARERAGRIVAVGTTVVRALETAALPGRTVRAGAAATDLVILPGFEFQIVDALITNFHLPRSSLLLLVAAFAGRERTLTAYREAVSRGYRFYSYGDAMLIDGRAGPP